MSKDNKENFSLISYFSKDLRIGIIGGGRAALIKSKHFLKEGAYVEVISKEYIEEFKELTNCKTLTGEYNIDFIKDKHLIVIAIDNEIVKEEIKNNCNENYKLYIDSSSFMDGNGVIPYQLTLENFIVGVNTIKGNPRGSRFIAEVINKEISKYDEFIGYTTKIRNNLKGELKSSISKFMGTEDFYFFYEKGKSNLILKIFYDEENINEFNNCN